jgi:hypothetical protein
MFKLGKQHALGSSSANHLRSLLVSDAAARDIVLAGDTIGLSLAALMQRLR